MYEITIHQRIKQIIEIYHVCRMWRQENATASCKIAWKITYLIIYVSFVMSIALGGFLSDDNNERIFLVSGSVTVAIVTVKLIYILWKKEEICAFLHDISVHSVTDSDEFTQIKKQVDKFMKFISCFMFIEFLELLFLIVCLPLFSSEKVLPINIAFPLDWKNSEIVYWMAYAFITIGTTITGIVTMLNIVVWYLMMNCSIKYQILGNQLMKMGSTSKTKADKTRIIVTKPTYKTSIITEKQKEELFLKELIGLIKVHQNIQETIGRFKSCFSDLFFAQITTSGLCMCGAVYVLAFSSNENLILNGIYFMLLVYNLFDIFVTMHFGNEIKLSSDRLSCCLFESNWMEQSDSCKKLIIILVEALKQPHQLIIAKLYSLDLGTFLAILNLAYSMFNILRNLNN